MLFLPVKKLIDIIIHEKASINEDKIDILKEGGKVRVFFCSRCGADFPAKAVHCPQCGFEPLGADPYDGVPTIGAGGIGWSTRIQDPQFNKYQKNKRKIILIWSIALAIVIPALLLVFNEGSLDGEGLIVAIVIGGMFLLIGLYSAMNTRRKGKGWDGVVADKKTFTRKRRVKEENSGYRIEHFQWL